MQKTTSEQDRETIKTRLMAVEGVIDVSVEEVVTTVVHTRVKAGLGSSGRRPVYNLEKEFYDAFPGVRFDFIIQTCPIGE